MPLTVQSVRQVIVNRLGPKLARVGITTDATVAGGVLDDCIRRAAGELGVIVATPLTVVDGDLVSLAGWQVEKLADLSTLAALRCVLGAATAVDQKVSHGEQKLNQFVKDVAAQIDQLQRELERSPFGPDIPTAAVAQIKAHERMPGDVYGSSRRRDERRREPWDFLPG
ncbi:MAG: hypothetical protein P4L84_11100 [Isosphaeraceae bacterium]|nr:hypothetical protein [Isosphaeraceae bacterium]